MPRYFVARKTRSFFVADDTYVEPMLREITVCDHEAIDTGLLDENGDPSMRVPRPIGFGRDEQW